MKAKVPLRLPLMVLTWVLPAMAAAQTDWAAQVGFTALQSRVSLIGGGNLKAYQVEASLSGGTTYMVDVTLANFSGKTFTDLTGGGLVSWHANKAGEYFYGNTTSLAGGLATISVREVNDYLSTVLRVHSPASTFPMPLTGFDVMNHSWAGTSNIAGALPRFNYQLDQAGVVAVVGVSNVESSGGTWSGFSIPPLMAQSYNAITVGSSDGFTSHGPLATGRTCLDLVAPSQWSGTGPNGKSSWSAARISSAAALLRSEAKGRGWTDAEDPRVIKAALMAGAVKLGERTGVVINSTGTTGAINAWAKGDPATTSDDTSRPLDYYQGAGQVNVDHSWDILAAGRQAASAEALVARTGWDKRNIASGAQQTYFFEVFVEAESLSAILTWHADAKRVGASWVESIADQNLDLYLYAVEAGSFLLPGHALQVSASSVDNVEHIWLTGVPPGRYALVVTGGAVAWDYALAWQTIGGERPTVEARQVFYNASILDGNDPAANAADDAAIDWAKQPLLPGQASGPANVTGYRQGLNGIMVDLADAPDALSISAADFDFQVSPTGQPGSWSAAPAPTSVTVRPGEGANGSDRVTIIWANGAILARWLRVDVLASANTGLPEADTFYWGNMPGDTDGDGKVNVIDLLKVQQNYLKPSSDPTFDPAADITRDGHVNIYDLLIVRQNYLRELPAFQAP